MMGTCYLREYSDDHMENRYVCDSCRGEWGREGHHKFCPLCGANVETVRQARMKHIPRGWWKRYASMLDTDGSVLPGNEVPDWHRVKKDTRPRWSVDWVFTEYLESDDVEPWWSELRDAKFSIDSKEVLERIKNHRVGGNKTYRVKYGKTTILIATQGERR